MRYGLIGERLSHSFSKEIHEAIADYQYELCEIAPSELEEFFKKREFCAINVTMPYKKEVIPFLDFISPVASELQAVNTVVNRHGKLCGYNTDYFGMRGLLSRSKIDIQGKKVLILGTGGTARTSALAAKDLGATEIYIVSRAQKDGAITYEEAISLHRDAQIIINTTPVGMYPKSYDIPLDLEEFDHLLGVFDAVYNPLHTPLTLEAKNRGIYSEGGLYMLVIQAVRAVELFLDAEIETAKCDEVFKKILKEKENIVLIGMPSSGKTTVGNILAQRLERELYDLDDEIEKHIGCSISDYFESHTENEFRDVESVITKEISMKTGVIIATGGGCILRTSNINALRSNGRLYFIDRDLNRLIPTHSRPLARGRNDIEKLYRLRYHLYQSFSDAQIDGDLEPDAVADLIGEEFYK